MEVLRQYNSSSVIVDIDELSLSEQHRLIYTDADTLLEYTAFATSNDEGEASFVLNNHYMTYTGKLNSTIFNSASIQVYDDVIDVVRPYCNISKVQNKLSLSLNSTIEYERVARFIINTITYPFTYQRLEKEFIGNGIGYLPVKQRIQKIYKIYENEELIYDSSKTSSENLMNFEISKDRTAIIESSDDKINRINYGPLWRDRFISKSFADGYEYVVDADYGWPNIPSDIQEACELLIQDISLNNLRYTTRYIESFDTDDFKIKFAKDFFGGTGNAIVDKILSRYGNYLDPGVL